MAGLTPQQERFCQMVAAGNTYADAYRESYKVSPKAKIETVWENSSRLMADSKVSARVREIQEQRIKENEVTLQEVLNELAEMIRFDPIELFDEDGCVKKMTELPARARKSLASPIEVVELFANGIKYGELKRIRFTDKQATIDKFMKYFGAYIDNHKVTIEDLSHLDDILKGIKR